MENNAHHHRDLERIGDLSNDGIFIYNVTERDFLYFNKRFAKIFNQPPTGLKNDATLVTRFLKEEDAFYLNKRFKELMRTGCITSTEFRLQLSDQNIRHICCDVFALEHRKTLVGFVKDVTDAKEHEDFIINTGARKDTLLDMITHNLAGPLNLSKNLLESVKKTYTEKNQAEIGADIKILLETTEQCIEIVNEFLQQEHQESAHVFVKKSRFDLIEKIKATLEKLKVTNPHKQFRMVTKLNNLNITTDSVKFFQIIHNVLSNAIKFTPENGKIDIVVNEHKKDFTISIKDNGIGIPAKYHPLIFNRKNGARRPGLKGEKSSGLGLSIARKLIDLIDGQIWFKSTIDKGSVFYIRLPKE